ncbi:TIGR02266 family protein [Deltaproteobacteria bacterium PRO3]|nr:TIGR02266 family protein [Deltaproteobacteria bacterium PRO3]
MDACMNAKTKKEKRLYPRRPIRTQVVFENEDSEGVLYFFSTDISAGGLFLESDIPVKLGTQVFLRFSLTPKARPIQATGEVVRVMRDQNEAGQGKVGIGIRFVYIHPLDRELIQDFINQAGS